MKIAALQLPALPMSESKLDYHLRIAASRGVELLLFGEYVMNLFFKELQKTPLPMIKEQSEKHLYDLRRFADEYGITLVAPLVKIKSGKPYKTIVKVPPKGKLACYYQQALIPYAHWNEAKFFTNAAKEFALPMSFTQGGIRFSVLFGFELHFDILWHLLKEKKTDVVLLPTVSTFESLNRWREIIRTRAFCNSLYVLRANRIGEYHDKETAWKFYGDSLLCRPDGEIESFLGETEEMLITDIDKALLKQTRKEWGFKSLPLGAI